MASLRREGPILRVETTHYSAAVRTEGYVSGVMEGSFVDRATGAADPGFGLCIADFLLEDGVADPSTPADLRYPHGDALHGGLAKRFVEMPQICTQAGTLPFETIQGADFVAVRQWYSWTQAPPPYRAGSRWEQLLVFPDGVRWFLAFERVTMAHDAEAVAMRMDMPGHIRHSPEQPFRQMYLSYEGAVPFADFAADFPPDARHLYRRGRDPLPERFIRACELREGVWLAGMSLGPAAVSEAWCHQRGYVCMIQEFGGRPVKTGESFGIVNLVGYFDNVAEMERTYDRYSGATCLSADANGWSLG